MKPGMSSFHNFLYAFQTGLKPVTVEVALSQSTQFSLLTIFDVIKIFDTMHGEAKSYCFVIGCFPENIFN